jgi:beta-galactosidase
VVQYYALGAPVPITSPLGNGSTAVWAESLIPTAPDTRVIMTYGESDTPSWLAGKPAALEHTFGKGTITYVGATLDPALMHALVASTLTAAGVEPILANLPAEVELMQRSSPNGSRIWILINHGTTPRAIDTGHDGVDLLTGKQDQHTTLAPHSVAVFALARTR